MMLELTRVFHHLPNKYEGTETAAAFNQLPTEYISRFTKGIVGFTIEVESIDNVFKLSQNHDEATRKSIVEKLRERGDEDSVAIAKEMDNVIGDKSND